MILPKIIWPPLLWLVLWLILMGNSPMEGATTEEPQTYAVSQPRQMDLGVLKEAASIGGTCSIITATIWACGLVAAARYNYLGRRNKQCGTPSCNS